MFHILERLPISGVHRHLEGQGRKLRGHLLRKIKRAPTVHRWGRGRAQPVHLRQVCPKCGPGVKSGPARGLRFNGLSVKIFSVWTSTQYCSIKQVHFVFCSNVCHLFKCCVFEDMQDGHFSALRFCPLENSHLNSKFEDI